MGAIAQLGERVLCKHEVVGSIPSGSTSYTGVEQRVATRPNTPVSSGSPLAEGFDVLL